MHILDLVIVAVVAWFTFSAFSRGLIREVVTTIAIFGGTIIAGQFYEELSNNLEFLTDDETLRNFGSFIAIFVGIIVLGQIAAMVLRRFAALLLLGPFDHLGGALFGFLKGVLIVEVVLILVTAFPVADSLQQAIDASALAPVFLDGLPVMLEVLPGEFREAVDALSEVARTAAGSSS
ncbi:MAG TPA: CvpA family protein [Dehalococcoidia bacterium]|jgi:membrane protein required for colicin V production|nr:CvpA family protein [Dehalococcoidia bacterium]